MKLLFIGNSATYVHEIPQTLARLAAEVGYPIEVTLVTHGGYELSQHADASTVHGQRVRTELGRGYDAVLLQDNGSCITTPEKGEACAMASRALANAARACGALPLFYVRPPYGRDLCGMNATTQCEQLERLFGRLSQTLSMTCVPVHRAFATAIAEAPTIPLWGPDNAHTSPEGAYLAVCTFFAMLTGDSAARLSPNGISVEHATVLQQIADRAAAQEPKTSEFIRLFR